MVVVRVAASVAALIFVTPALSSPIDIVVQTEIKDKVAAFQIGVKSIQTIIVDFEAKTVTSAFSTGTTNLGVTELKSVRNGFTIGEIVFSGSEVSFRATGETASGVTVLPNINYSLTFKLDVGNNMVTLGGCHDGYPSYRVTVNSSIVYDFEQEYLLALFGNCDSQVALVRGY